MTIPWQGSRPVEKMYFSLAYFADLNNKLGSNFFNIILLYNHDTFHNLYGFDVADISSFLFYEEDSVLLTLTVLL